MFPFTDILRVSRFRSRKKNSSFETSHSSNAKIGAEVTRIQTISRDDSPEKNDDDDNSDDDDDNSDDCNEESEYPSLSSVGSGGSMGSGGDSSSPSLTQSMAMVEQVLSNGCIDRFEKIDRLEAILSAATQVSQPASTSPGLSSSRPSSACCICHCHSQTSASPMAVSPLQSIASHAVHSTATPRYDAQCQTLSTGDIVITKVFFADCADVKEKLSV